MNRSSSSPGLCSWRGNPDDDAAHRKILHWLSQAVTSGFLKPTEPMSNQIKGNLGEFIAYRIGQSYVFTNRTIVDAANAWDPLGKISRSGIDIVWLYFGSSAADDWAALQEVKTTSESSLRLADDLIADYDKLFGENVRFTLQTRLTALKNKLDHWGLSHLCSRVTALGGPNPNQARGVQVVPTLVHDAHYDSSTKMTAIRQALIGRGWTSDAVHCWTFAMDDLDDRLVRLVRGQT